MTFQEVLAQVIGWLQHHKRLSYRALKRQLLAEIYGWGTEGFGTAALQEAKALIEDLS